MMTLGRFKVSLHNHGFLRLDGGSMFGTVPKVMWSKLMPPDADNRIALATRSLVVEDGERTYLVDAGTGDHWPDKFKDTYGVRPFADSEAGFDPGRITDVVVTHFHFDHGGGLWKADPSGEGGSEAIADRFRGATIHIQAANLDTAKNPNARERASYVKELAARLERAPLALADGTDELAPGLFVHRSDGHTRGLQWVEVRGDGQTIAFPSDMIPYSTHVPLAYTMAYDICAEALLREKEDFLRRAAEGNWIVVFEHDPTVPAARLKIDERGRFAIAEKARI